MSSQQPVPPSTEVVDIDVSAMGASGKCLGFGA